MNPTLRRSKLLALGTATAASLTILRRPSGAAEFTYRMGHPNPVDYPIAVRFVQWADAVKAETRGRLEIQIFPNSQLGSNTAMLGQLRLGSIQFMQAANPDYASVVPVAQIDSLGAAFTSRRQAIEALDGPLGAYIRAQFLAKGIFAFEQAGSLGFRQEITTTKAIRTADDCAGMKLRSAPAPISVEFWKTLGASPVYIATAEAYPGLQTHLIDGMETPLSSIEAFKWYEVAKYLSITNHTNNGYWIVANADAWKALPADIQTIAARNMRKYVLLMRSDFEKLDIAAPDKLRSLGMTVNTVDTSSIRARLGPYYAHWKDEFGPTAWGLLEGAAGKLA